MNSIIDDLAQALENCCEKPNEQNIARLVAAAGQALGALEVVKNFELQELYQDMVEIAASNGHTPKRWGTP